MEQESLEAHNMQLEYMRQNIHLFSAEDVGMLQLALHGQPSQLARDNDEDDDGSFASEDGAQVAGPRDGDVEENGDEEEEGWSYEQLLSLGHALGGNVCMLL